MLYLFCGNNRLKLQAKVARVLAKFSEKNPTGAVFRFDSDNFDQAKFAELLHGDSLFGEKRLIFCQDLAGNKLASDFMLANLDQAINSTTVVLWFEASVITELAKRVKQAGGQVEEFVVKPTEFNLFSLTDALGSRDRAKLWLLFQQALKAGVPAEEIFWRLVWQVKNMLLVSQNTQITSLKPFVVQKAKQASRNFTLPELNQLSNSLVRLWHETKREDGRDFGLELERFLLTV